MLIDFHLPLQPPTDSASASSTNLDSSSSSKPLFEVMSRAGRVVVYGGKGGLGSHLVSHFKANNFWVLSIGKSANEEADANCLVEALDSWSEQEAQVHSFAYCSYCIYILSECMNRNE